MFNLPPMTEQQINVVLTALGQRPYVEVATIMDMIAVYIQEQRKPVVPPQEPVT